MFAEADGNRTRLSRDAAHTGFEDRGAHQDPDASSSILGTNAAEVMAPTAIPTATAADNSRLLIQQPVHDRGGVAHQPGSHVAVAVQCDADLAVAQQFLDHLGMLTL